MLLRRKQAAELLGMEPREMDRAHKVYEDFPAPVMVDQQRRWRDTDLLAWREKNHPRMATRAELVEATYDKSLLTQWLETAESFDLSDEPEFAILMADTRARLGA